MKSNMPTIDYFKSGLMKIGTAALTVKDWAVDAFQRIKERALENSPVIDGVKGVVQDLGDKAIWLKDMMLQAFEASKPALSWLKDEGLPLVVDGIAGVIDTATGLYNYINDNWNAISPIVYGIATAIGVYKVGMVVATTATTVLTGVTTAMTIAQGALNAVMALSPLGWVALAIGAVIAVGVALYKNWDAVKEKALELWGVIYDNPLLALVMGPIGALILAGIEIHKNWDTIKEAGQQLWDKTKEVFGGMYDWAAEKIAPITSFFKGLYDKFMDFKTAISSFTPPEWVSKIGGAIGGAVSKVKNFVKGPEASFDVGTNRVKRDMVAKVHKDEMIVPATQSHNLRKQGVTINNIDKGGLTRPTQVRVASTAAAPSSSNQLDSGLLMQLIQAIKNMPKGDTIINVNGSNLTVTEIVNELIPLLKLRLANM